MIKRALYLFSLLLLASILFFSGDFQTIAAGIAIFLIGMVFMEDGFKLFGGGFLEKVLHKTTSSTKGAITTGFLATSLMQSSSLVSVIVISFLSAELITLSGAIGVIFGSNLGTTTTAWIVSTFGLKLDIASLSMPMIIFGVIFRINQSDLYRGFGNVLLGLGFIFLGIGYMKDGFDALKNGIDLAKFAMQGYLGLFVFTLVGAVATVVIQSSSATMALIITALASSQITYENALALAIGANIGTTVTAVIGALASNENGKRLAVAHFIFNISTGVVAISFIYTFADIVDFVAHSLGVQEDNFTIKLAIFHTFFNIVGVVIMTPSINILVRYLNTILKPKSDGIQRAKYFTQSVVNHPQAAMNAMYKECFGLFENGIALIQKAFESSSKKSQTNIESLYTQQIKHIYGDILTNATLAQQNMDANQIQKSYEMKVACKNLVEAVKDTKHLLKNFSQFIDSQNRYIQKEYEKLKTDILQTALAIKSLEQIDNESQLLVEASKIQLDIEQSDIIQSGTLDQLIRQNHITSQMATSLMNDSAYAYDIRLNLLHSAQILYFVVLKENIDVHEDIMLQMSELNNIAKEQ